MPSVYGGQTQTTPKTAPSSGSIYGRAGSSRAGGKTKKKKTSLLKFNLGLLENLGKDIYQSVEGLPSGVKALVSHPIRTAEQIGESYAQTYGPLARGDINQFGQNVYEHPLGPILDALAVATLGAGAGVKAGALPANVTQRGFATGVLEVTQRTARNPLTGAIQRGSRYASTAMIPHATPVIGEHARAVRLASKQARREDLAQRERNILPFRRAIKNLSRDERKMLPLMTEGLAPSERIAFVEERLQDAKNRLASAEERAGKRITKTGKAPILTRRSKEIRGEISDHKRQLRFLRSLRDEDFHNPNPRLKIAYEEARKLEMTEGDILEAVGRLTPEARALRPYRPAQIIRGARYQEAKAPSIVLFRGRPPEGVRAGFRGGPSIEALRAELPNLFRFPHIGPKLREGAQPQVQAGAVKPRPPGTTKLFRGLRLLASRYLPTPAAWEDSYVRALGYSQALARGKLAAQIARPLLSDGSINKNHYYLNLDNEKISRAARERTTLDEQFDEFVGGSDELESFVSERIATQSPDIAKTWEDAGLRVGQISRADYRQIFGDIRASSAFVRKFMDMPTDFWRALTLNLRPAWIVNNLVGQHLLYALNNSDVAGAKAYAQAILGKGWLPEELRFGLFASEQSFEGIARQATGVFQRANRAIGRFNAIITDELPRRADFNAGLMRTWARDFKKNNITYKQFVEEMKKATDDPVGGHPELRAIHDELAQNTLDHMIDFQNLSAFERGYVRRVFPFYSWMKGVTKALGILTLEHPAKALLIYQLSSIGILNLQKDLGHIPDFLWNIIPFGKAARERNVIGGGALNPYQTVADIAKKGLFENPAADIGPVPRSLIEALAGRRLFSGEELGTTGGLPGIAGRFAKGFGYSFPQERVVRSYLAPPEKGNRLTVPGARYDILGVPITSELLRYFGVPIKRINVPRAQELGRERESARP